MATSGYFYTASWSADSGGTRYLEISWNRTNYSVENNTSTISYTLKAKGSYTGWVNARNINLVINGTTVYSAAGPIKLYSGTVLKSGTITIKHNNDGTKSFSASAKCGIYYSTINSEGSKTFTIDTIPRKSTVKATNGNIGSNTTISITSASSTFTHNLSWEHSASGEKGTIATGTKETSIKFIIPTKLYDVIPNNKETKITIKCETIANGVSLGSNLCEITATVDKVTCSPTVKCTSIEDYGNMSTPITGNPKIFIKDLSMAKVSGISASAKNGAKLVSVEVKCGIWTKSALKDGVVQSEVSAILVQSNKFEIIATDSRGYSTTTPYTVTMYDYFAPKITATVKRVEQTGSAVKVEYSGKFCNNEVTKGMSLKVRCYHNDTLVGNAVEIAAVSENGTVTVPNGGLTLEDNDFSGGATIDIGIDYRKEYVFEFTINDTVQDVSHQCSLIRGIPIFDWGENDFNFNVPVTFQDAVNFSQPATVDDDPVTDTVIEQGTKNVTDPNTSQTVAWGYRKWNSGIAECWISRNVNCNVTSKWGTALYYGTVSTINFPFPFVEVPVVNVSCEYITSDDKSLFIASCGYSSQNYARPIMLCRTDSGTFDCKLLYQVIGRWK